jgi:hypothetical protein
MAPSLTAAHGSRRGPPSVSGHRPSWRTLDILNMNPCIRGLSHATSYRTPTKSVYVILISPGWTLTLMGSRSSRPRSILSENGNFDAAHRITMPQRLGTSPPGMMGSQNDMRQLRDGGGESKKTHFSNSHLREDLANLVIYAFFCPTHVAFSIFSLLY